MYITHVYWNLLKLICKPQSSCWERVVYESFLMKIFCKFAVISENPYYNVIEEKKKKLIQFQFQAGQLNICSGKLIVFFFFCCYMVLSLLVRYSVFVFFLNVVATYMYFTNIFSVIWTQHLSVSKNWIRLWTYDQYLYTFTTYKLSYTVVASWLQRGPELVFIYINVGSFHTFKESDSTTPSILLSYQKGSFSYRHSLGNYW